MAKKKLAALTGTATAPVRVEVRLTDQKYESHLLTDDVQHGRAWFEGPADGEGWMKLYYSADGPDGDPFPIGKIRFILTPDDLDGHFKNVSKLSVEEEK